jgi:hypothetical protein
MAEYLDKLRFAPTSFVPTESHVREQYRLAGFKVRDPYEPCAECGAAYQGVRIVKQDGSRHVAEFFACEHVKVGRRV